MSEYGSEQREGTVRVEWLGGLDSNQDEGNQSPLCYRYTTAQRAKRRPVYPCEGRRSKVCRDMLRASG